MQGSEYVSIGSAHLFSTKYSALLAEKLEIHQVFLRFFPRLKKISLENPHTTPIGTSSMNRLLLRKGSLFFYEYLREKKKKYDKSRFFTKGYQL